MDPINKTKWSSLRWLFLEKPPRNQQMQFGREINLPSFSSPTNSHRNLSPIEIVKVPPVFVENFVENLTVGTPEKSSHFLSPDQSILEHVVKRANERPLFLRALIVASKAVMIPWIGLCLVGLFTPVLAGISAVSFLATTVNASFLVLLWHEWHHICDIAKSLKVSENYPQKGKWTQLIQHRIKPAITITSLPECATLVDGTIAASLRTLSRHGKGDVFLITDSKKICNKLGKEFLAHKWNKIIAKRDAIRRIFLQIINGREIGVNLKDGISVAPHLLEQLIVEIGEKHNIGYCAIRDLVKHIKKGEAFSVTPEGLLMLAEKAEISINPKVAYKIAEEVKAAISERIALEMSDFIALDYQKELEVSIRYLCEKHGLSRRHEVELIDKICILKTIKEKVAAEGIDEITDISERRKALQSLLQEIGDANWLKKIEINELIEKWLSSPATFMFLSIEELKEQGVTREVFEEITAMVKREERRESISILGRKIVSEGNFTDQEKQVIIQHLFEEFGKYGVSEGDCNILVKNILQNVEEIELSAKKTVGEYEGFDQKIKDTVLGFMQKQHVVEEKFSLKEIIRAFSSYYCHLSNDEAEVFSVKVIELLAKMYPLTNIENLPWIISSENLKEVISISLDRQLGELKSFHVQRLTKLLFKEFVDMRVNAEYARDAFLQKISKEMAKMIKICSMLAKMPTVPEIKSFLNSIALKEQLSEEILPVFVAFVEARIEAGLPINNLPKIIADYMPEMIVAGIIEHYGIVKTEDIKDSNMAITDSSEEIKHLFVGFMQDWPNSVIGKTSLSVVLRMVSGFSEKMKQKKDIKNAITDLLGLEKIKISEKEIYQITERIRMFFWERDRSRRRISVIDDLKTKQHIGNEEPVDVLLGIARSMKTEIDNKEIRVPLFKAVRDAMRGQLSSRVYFVHRSIPRGEKPGSLADVTGGKSIESRVRDLLHLIVHTFYGEQISGRPSIHSNPEIVTKIDREICQEIACLKLKIGNHEYPFVVNPEVFLDQILKEQKGGAVGNEVADNLLNQLSASIANEKIYETIKDWKICEQEAFTVEEIKNGMINAWKEGAKLKDELNKSIVEVAHAISSVSYSRGPRKINEIVEQLIVQCGLPEAAEIEGRKYHISSVLRFLVPLLEHIFVSQTGTEFRRSSKLQKVITVDEELRRNLKEMIAKSQGKDQRFMQFALSCLTSKMPPLNVSYDAFVQFDAEHHPQRDYILENGAYLISHPSLFLVQTRHHYARNLYAHPLIVGTNAQHSMFYEHIKFAKTYDNAVFPAGSGMLLPRDAWGWGGEWNEEVEYVRAVDNNGKLIGKSISPLLKNIDKIPWVGKIFSSIIDFVYSHTILQLRDLYWISGIPQRFAEEQQILKIGGRIYYQPEDTVTEDIAAGPKYHRLGYLSVLSPGIHHLAKGPSGLNHFMATQLHRWARGGLGELRLKRTRGSTGTLKELIINRSKFSKVQRLQYIQSTSYFLTGISNFVIMSAPLLFLVLAPAISPILAVPLAVVIALNMAIRTWIYPISMKQRGVSMKESLSLVGLTLFNWERWWHAAYYSLVKRVKGEFGVTKKWGAMTKIDLKQKSGLRLGIGPMGMMAANSVAFPLGIFLAVSMGSPFPLLWGIWGLYCAVAMGFSWHRYNRGCSPLPPQSGNALLKVIKETKDKKLFDWAMNELVNPERNYSKRSINKAMQICASRLNHL